MIYTSNEARTTAKEKIHVLSVKLATTKPTDNLTLQDISSIRYYLGVLSDGIQSEIYQTKRKEHEREYERRRAEEDKALYEAYCKRLTALQCDIAQAKVEEDVAKAYKLIEKFAAFNHGVAGVIEAIKEV